MPASPTTLDDAQPAAAAQAAVRASSVGMEAVTYRMVVGLCLVSMVLGLALAGPVELWRGSLDIMQSPSRLLTDYIAVGNLGATFFNAGFITVLSTLIVRVQRAPLTGLVIAGFYTVYAFAFFGKNLFNTIPITVGVYLYARLTRGQFREHMGAMLFATALAPAVSHVAFGIGSPVWLGVITGYATGLLLGFVVPPLAAQFKKFHHGLSLYNIGFTAGMVGMLTTAVLNLFGFPAELNSLYSRGNDLVLRIFIFVFCAALFAVGLKLSNWSMRGEWQLWRRSGRYPGDFVERVGLGDTMMNMGIIGAMSTALVWALGGELNGPLVGGVFTTIGFGAFGKHALNVIPIWVGVAVGSLIMDNPLGSTAVLLTMLFGTTISPLASVYGPLAGVFAGFMHSALVLNTAALHGGLNLYNHGFAGGLIAILLIPIFNAVLQVFRKPDRTVNL
ncbi:MAG: DUF1576 domain-containing protein [Promicromonosporaceae bacterium]|nr:DUF1576 domain-containing protein [Promicromonosporaceae bacterium]